MNPDPAQTQREQMEVRLVALLLGEASPFEEAELVKAMQQDPSLTAFYTEMLATLGLVQEASKTAAHADEIPAPPIAQPKLTAERRAALLAHFKQPAQQPAEAPAAAPAVVAVKGEPIPLPKVEAKPTNWYAVAWRLAALFLVLGVLASLLMPAGTSAKKRAMKISESSREKMAELEDRLAREDAPANAFNPAGRGLGNPQPDAQNGRQETPLSLVAGGRVSGEQSSSRYYRESGQSDGGAAVVSSPQPGEPARVAAVSVFLPKDAGGVEGLAVGQDNGRLGDAQANEFAEIETRGRTLNRGVAGVEIMGDGGVDNNLSQTDFFTMSDSRVTSGVMGGGGGGGGGFGGGKFGVVDSPDQVVAYDFAYAANPQAQPGQAAPSGRAWYWDANEAGAKPITDKYAGRQVADVATLDETPALGRLFKDSSALAQGGDVKAGEVVALYRNNGDGTFVSGEKNLAQNLETYSRPVAGKPAAAPAAPAGSAGTDLNFGLLVADDYKSAAPTSESKPVDGLAAVELGKPVLSGVGGTVYSINAVGYAGAVNTPAAGSGPAAATPATAAPPPPPPTAKAMPSKPVAPVADRELALKDLDVSQPVTRSRSDVLAAGLSSVSGTVAPASPPPASPRPTSTVTAEPASGQGVVLGRRVARDEVSALGVDKSLSEEPMVERFALPARELKEVNQQLAENETRQKQQAAAGTTSERLSALEKSPQPMAPETAGRKAAEFDGKEREVLKRQAEAGNGVALVTNGTATWADYNNDGLVDVDNDGDLDLMVAKWSRSSGLGGATADAKKLNEQALHESEGKAAQTSGAVFAGRFYTNSIALGDQSESQLIARAELKALDVAKKEAATGLAADRSKAGVAELPKLSKLSEVSKAKGVSEVRELKSEAPAPRPAPAPALLHQPEVATAENSDVNFSTFSLNVSDVAFKTAAASLGSGAMPDPNTVRVEEFINAFKYRDPAPAAGAPLAFAWERARHPFAHNRDLLRFSVQTAAQGREAARPLNLVLLLDNSGSMERPDRVQILNESLKVLANKLQPQDKISVVAFSRTARLWVDGLAGGKPNELMQTVATFNPQGGTDLEAGLNLAYQTAVKHFLPNGNNRVIMLTDGAANLGEVEPETLKQKVVAHRQKGISLDCFGVGWEGYADDVLEVLARNGDGRYAFLNEVEQAGAEFAEKLAGALSVAASDVKTQVEFNPQRVTAYRQVGYAKHQLTKQQFRDNTVDAAEIAAAEAGNAMYVIQVNPQGSGPLGVVRVRFKEPATGAYVEKEWTLPYQPQVPALDQASPPMRLASVAATFGEWLARNPYAAEANLSALAGYMNGVPEFFSPDPRPKQLAVVLQQAMVVSGQK